MNGPYPSETTDPTYRKLAVESITEGNQKGEAGGVRCGSGRSGRWWQEIMGRKCVYSGGAMLSAVFVSLHAWGMASVMECAGNKEKGMQVWQCRSVSCNAAGMGWQQAAAAAQVTFY